MALLLVALIVGTCGCATVREHKWWTPEHPKAVVSKPATVGAVIGGVACGGPFVILGLPITIPYAIAHPHQPSSGCGGDPFQNTPVILMPGIPTGLVGAAIGTTAFGLPPWLVFGWWGKGGLVFTGEVSQAETRANTNHTSDDSRQPADGSPKPSK